MSDTKFRVYECPVCHQWYNSHDRLKQHYSQYHPDYEALETITQRAPVAQPRFAFQCVDCGQLFHGADDLIKHGSDQHPEKHVNTIVYEQILQRHEQQLAELKARLDAMEAGK